MKTTFPDADTLQTYKGRSKAGIVGSHLWFSTSFTSVQSIADCSLVTCNAISSQVYNSWYNQPKVMLSDQGSTENDLSGQESTTEDDIVELSSSLADLNVPGKFNLMSYYFA